MIYKVNLNGKTFEVEVEKGEAVLMDVSSVSAAPAQVVTAAPATPAAPPAAAGGESIFSPLPGVVLELKTAPGQTVTKGQVLLVIEAMKMENEILAPRDGTVLQVACEKGGSVNTGDLLIVLA